LTVAWPLAAGRVDVNTADDVAGGDAEHGVGEPAALGEIPGVPLQVAQIVSEGHLVWPAALAEPRRRADVINAGRPGSVIGLVVLRAERGQPEVPRYEPLRYHKAFRNEQPIAHPAILTSTVTADAPVVRPLRATGPPWAHRTLGRIFLART